MLAAYVTTPDGKNLDAVYCVLDGVNVGSAGELALISSRNDHGRAIEFTIFAPGTWKEVSVNPHE